jgi:hypothetical protein
VQVVSPWTPPTPPLPRVPNGVVRVPRHRPRYVA